MLGVLLTASAVAGLVAFINSQQNRSTSAYDAPAEPAAEAAPAAELAPATPEPAPEAPAAPPEDYSYMYSLSDDELRAHAQSYQPGYDRAASILASRQSAREATAYNDAQGNITGLVRFINNWPSGANVEYARADLQRLIQKQKYNISGRAWLKSSGTYAYRAPTYDADAISISDTVNAWTTTGTISNDGVSWVEISVNVQGQVISAYVSQNSLSYSDPNYRAPSPPPPPPPAPTYTAPPVTTRPYRSVPVPPPAPAYVTIGSRRWANEPSDSQFRKISESMRIRSAMSIMVDCRVGSDYRLVDCQVVSPGNLNDRQWDGVLDLAKLYIAPQSSADGYPTQGKRVKITFAFDP